MSVNGQMMNGHVAVFTTEGRGHSPEELAGKAACKADLQKRLADDLFAPKYDFTLL